MQVDGADGSLPRGNPGRGQSGNNPDAHNPPIKKGQKVHALTDAPLNTSLLTSGFLSMAERQRVPHRCAQARGGRVTAAPAPRMAPTPTTRSADAAFVSVNNATAFI